MIGVVILVVPLVVEVVHELPGSLLEGRAVAVDQLTHRLPQGPVRKITTASGLTSVDTLTAHFSNGPRLFHLIVDLRWPLSAAHPDH